MMRLMVLIVSIFLLIPPARAGVVRGTLPVLSGKQDSNRGDGFFWRLDPAPVDSSAATSMPAVIVLEGPAAGAASDDTGQEDPATIDIEGYGMWPPLRVVTTESTVRIRNRDPRPYSCFAKGHNAFQFSQLGQGKEHEARFLSGGVVNVRCHRFPFMHTTILVVDSPYYTLGQTGQPFAFRHVPQGQYALKVFAGGSWRIQRDVQVTASGTLNVDLAGESDSQPSGKPPVPTDAGPSDQPSADKTPPPEKQPAADSSPPTEKQPQQKHRDKRPAADKPPATKKQPKPKQRPTEKKPVEKKAPADKQPPHKKSHGKKPPRNGEAQPTKEPDEAVEPAFKDVEPEIEIEEE